MFADFSAGGPGVVRPSFADVAYGAHPLQRLDVHVPAGALAAPIIVLVHGGAWSIGDKALPGLLTHKLAHWLPQGRLVVSVNYRLLPEAGPLEQARDLASAVAHVQRHAADWGGDGGRVVLVGHSTGAHLAALVAADPGLLATAGAAPVRGQVLLDSAALDVVALMDGTPLPLHGRVFGLDRTAWPTMSPRHRLRGVPAPTLLVHSLNRDDSASQAQSFASMLRAAGGRAEVFGSPLPHAEISRRLGLPNRLTQTVDTFLASLDAG